MIVNAPVPDTFEDTPAKDRDPEWFKRAVFYEVLVRSFQDSNGDGVGDLKGITAKLDYLQWLGVDCLWLPPFFKSPLRDGGYDVSDYTAVLPEFGDLADFVEFVDAAHQRGMRVIIDFVMNHTSDQHPWFQESRNDPDGPYGDYYMWADDDKQYADARIIFVDTEVSNWTFDPVRKQYFFHRFFSHQPDLNYENPAVQDEIISALRFWLDLGIDGFRLDAVPYLYAAGGHELREPPRDPRVPQAGPQGDRRRTTRTRCSWPRPTSGPRTSSTTSATTPRAATNATWRSTSPSCPASSWPSAASRATPSPRSCQDPGDPRQLPVGHLPAQPRRAHPRNGHRRRTRLHVRGVREGPADARQHRHPPPARTPARQRPQPDRAVHRPAALPARLADPLLRRRDRHGRQHLARRPRRASAPRCSGPPTATPASPPATPAGSTCRPSWTRSTATRSPTSRRPMSLALLAAALDPPHDRDPQTEPRVRPRLVHRTAVLATPPCSPSCASTGRPGAVRAQLLALRPAHRARPAARSTAATRWS